MVFWGRAPAFVLAALGALSSSEAAPLGRVGIGTLDFESALPASMGNNTSTVTLSLAFPDTIAATDTRAILASMGAGKGKPLLPRGRLTRAEDLFLTGLRALMDGNALSAAETWQKIRPPLTAELAGSLRVNVGVFHMLRGEPAEAESLWVDEWRKGVAAEAAWLNLFNLQMAQGRYRRAEALADAMLAEQPGQRTALQAKAALLRQFRPEAEWEEFVRTRALASPDMQLVYGELLVRRGRYAEAVKYLDRGLAERPLAGRGWLLLAEAQYEQGNYYFAIDCLRNAGATGAARAEFYELYARVLQACCTGDSDPRATGARKSAQEMLEKGLPKDLQRRSMAQLLYHMYAQNENPEAAKQLEKDLWFHFEGPRRDVPTLAAHAWDNAGVDARRLRVKFGMYAYPWVVALRGNDVYRPPL